MSPYFIKSLHFEDGKVTIIVVDANEPDVEYKLELSPDDIMNLLCEQDNKKEG